MRRPSILLASILVSALLAAPSVRADPVRSYHFTLQVLRVPDKTLDEHCFIDQAAIRGLVASHRVEEVDVLAGDGSMGEDVRMLAGYKIPLAFNDPRAGGYQVQYVDCGLKVDLKVTPDASDPHRLQVDIQSEKLGLEDPGTTSLPYLQGVDTRSRFTLESGQMALFARTYGELSKTLKQAWPGVTFSNTDAIVFALSVDSP